AGVMGAESRGANIIPRFCEIRYPYDTMDPDTVLNIGHQFHHVIPFDQFYTRANTFIDTYNFRINNNIDKILTRAIINNNFEMYYQPIYSVKDKKFLSAEALIRLNDEEFGFISPGLFIPAAERMGLMNPIGDFVLESVFSFISSEDFYDLGMDYIELNLSVAQCIQSDLSDKIFALGKKYYVNPDRVNLEITETTYENIGGVVDQNIRTLSENGFSFSLDDYGTGYSNMHRISRIPLKIIKIDKTMVDDMTNDSGMSVMRNTVAMIKDIDKEIVCEGIENAGQLECLSELGVDYIQGYYFSKPLPKKEFISFIKEKNGVLR
ncbi:MAG: EAL domain-containing protein, partial [Ruminiclostridium sp.]|nr:EAL domain-containing protein [Ruminiclostridium sp.]